MRKIIQISNTSSKQQTRTRHQLGSSRITALCDDGTVWVLDYDSTEVKRVWKKQPDIPQTDQ